MKLLAVKSLRSCIFLRWGVEGFFNLVKGRLNLENFTGKSLESIYQDFWSTIFITNAETVFTYENRERIEWLISKRVLTTKINKAVSFNAIKNMAFELFLMKAMQKKRMKTFYII